MLTVIIVAVVAAIIGGLMTANNSGGPVVGALLFGVVGAAVTFIFMNTAGALYVQS